MPTSKKKVFKKIGGGAFAKVESTQVKGRKLVIKRYRGMTTPHEMQKLSKENSHYLSCLKKAGIGFVRTRSAKMKRGIFGKIVIVQEEIEKEHILSNKVKTAPKQEVISLFEKTLEIVKKVENFNKKGGERIGIDIFLKNLAEKNGEVLLFDTYPALVQNGKEIDTMGVYLKRKNPVLRRIALALFPKREINRARKNIQKKFDPKWMSKIVIEEFTTTRPELREDLNKIFHQKGF